MPTSGRQRCVLWSAVPYGWAVFPGGNAYVWLTVAVLAVPTFRVSTASTATPS